MSPSQRPCAGPPGSFPIESNQYIALVFERRSERGSSRYVYEFEGADAYRFRIEMSPDGERWTTWMDSAWRRAR